MFSVFRRAVRRAFRAAACRAFRAAVRRTRFVGVSSPVSSVASSVASQGDGTVPIRAAYPRFHEIAHDPGRLITLTHASSVSLMHGRNRSRQAVPTGVSRPSERRPPAGPKWDSRLGRRRRAPTAECGISPDQAPQSTHSASSVRHRDGLPFVALRDRTGRRASFPVLRNTGGEPGAPGPLRSASPPDGGTQTRGA